MPTLEQEYEKALQTLATLREKRFIAFQDTLNAEAWYGERFDAIWGEEWQEFTEQERKDVISDEYERDEVELEEEIARIETEMQIFQDWQGLRELTEGILANLEGIAATFGWEKEYYKHSLPHSHYITFLSPEREGIETIELDIRISDHPQVKGGGWKEDPIVGGYRRGESDYDIVVTPEGITERGAKVLEKVMQILSQKEN